MDVSCSSEEDTKPNMENIDVYTNPDGRFLGKVMSEMKNSRELTDIILKVDGDLYYAHKVVLSANSKYFRNLFLCETDDKYKEEIELHGVQGDGFKKVFQYMYSQTISVSYENVSSILAVAEYFDMGNLKNFCLRLLRKYLLNIDNAVSIYQIAKLYCDSRLQKKANMTIIKHLRRFQNALNCLDYEEYKSIISFKPSYDFGQVSTDDEAVFASASLWVKHDKENREKYFYDLIQLVEPSNMSTQALKKLIHDDFVNEQPKVTKQVYTVLANRVETLEKDKQELENKTRSLLTTINSLQNEKLQLKRKRSAPTQTHNCDNAANLHSILVNRRRVPAPNQYVAGPSNQARQYDRIHSHVYNQHEQAMNPGNQ